MPPSSALRVISRSALVGAWSIVALSATSPAAWAQASSDVCYGFSFGAWTPPLDRAAAGHDPTATGGPDAPAGRGWAASDSSAGAALLLFPTWWPAGVRVVLAGPPPAVADTVIGTATALVADGRRRAPASAIRVWGVPCRRD